MIQFGKVEYILDPLKLGRVKIRVLGFHDNRTNGAYKIATKDLPWSQVMMPANTPAINGIGSSVNLLVGTLVAGEFLDNTQQEFIVIGTLPTKTNGVADNSGRTDGIDKNAAKPTTSLQPPSTFKPVYPHNNVMETESGHIKEYDDTPSAERILERHMSGTHYELSPNGSKTEIITRDNYRLVVGHDTLEVYGNVKVIISGHADVAVAGNLTASVAGNISADAKGDITALSLEGDIAATSTKGNITVTTTDTTKKITLAGNVDITENLTVAKDVTVTGKTRTSTSQLIDDHNHTHAGSNWTQNGNTTNLT